MMDRELPASMFRPALFTPHDDGPAIDSSIVMEAARWMATLQSGIATMADDAACLRWRQAVPEHERAWQRLQALTRDVRDGASGVSATVARATLRGKSRQRRITLKGIAGVLVVGLGAGLMHEDRTLRRWTADHGTGTGGHRTETLPDGTEITLDTRTALDVRYTDDERRVVLHSGRILVSTAPDVAQRPMRIVTASGSVSPVGTRFTVRFEPDHSGDVTTVAVMQGAVDLVPRRGGPTRRLQAGHQTRFTSASTQPETALGHAETAWTDGMLVAERMPLADFVAELDRYRHGRLRCDPVVAALRVSGAFPVRDPDAVLSLLQETLPVRVREFMGLWTTVGPATPG